MKAQELRIGNYVLTDGDQSTILGIYYDGRISTSEYEGGDLVDFIEPIPLTEEWVRKFGFEGNIHKVSHCGNFYLGYDPEYYRHKMALWHQKGSWCFSHTETFTVLKYVHQLQNLYFTLTEEELELSKDTLTSHDLRDIDNQMEERKMK